MAFRKKEPWMAPGSVVCIPSGRGLLETVVECVGSAELLPLGDTNATDHYGNFYPKQEMVMHVYVRPDGVQHAWPYNPWDIELAA